MASGIARGRVCITRRRRWSLQSDVLNRRFHRLGRHVAWAQTHWKREESVMSYDS